MKNPKNKLLNEGLANYLPGSIHSNFNFSWDVPGHHFINWAGQFLTNVDGNKYVDFFSRFGANILWHKNKNYTDSLCNFFSNHITAVDHFGKDEIDACQLLISSIPVEDLQVRFCTSGTEAVLNALRLARAYTKKKIIIRFQGHYHGNTDTILGGIGYSSDWYLAQPLENDPRWTEGRSSSGLSETLILPWNDCNALEAAMGKYWDNIAAVIMEPIAINWGWFYADANFFQTLKSISIEKNFLIIFDEVITGFRINYWSVFQITGIIPDVFVFGKAIWWWSLPISSIVASSKIMSLYSEKRVTHGGTFNGYPLGLYALKTTLSILSQPSVYENAILYAEELRNVVQNAANKLNLWIVVQWPSMAMVIHAGDEELIKMDQWTSSMKSREWIIRSAFAEENIILAPLCRIYPTIMINKEVIDFISERIDKVMFNIQEAYGKIEW